jgi:hypothetical protein
MPRLITYIFEFEDGSSWKYELRFDDKNRFIHKPAEKINPWTNLEFNKCSNCPLKKEQSPQCPVARGLEQVVEDSKSTLSFTKAKMKVVTPERTYEKNAATQDGLRSIFGMIMASAGCPHLDWFRPLARFHLPFADIEETLFRTLSLQLLEDFLNDGELSNSSERLKEKYRTVETVNHGFVKRIRSYCKGDADKNAIAALDVFVQMFPYHLESDFKALRAYFTKEPGKP